MNKSAMSISRPQDGAQWLAQPGRLTRTLLQWLMKPTSVTAIKTLSPRFRLVDLEGDALKEADWTPGQKIQMAMGTGLTARTYTPMSWDANRGRTRMLTFAHGDGPGSRWSSGLQVGDTCQFFGPRRSLDLAGLELPVIFGDETSFGLAAALSVKAGDTGARCVFEASDLTESHAVLEAIGLGDAVVIQRTANDGHLAATATELVRLSAGGTPCILTGKASSIQHVSRALKAAAVASSRVKAKAYWAPGKTGLD